MIDAPRGAASTEEAGTGRAARPWTGRRFRPDVEGMRAVAVLAVLAYHAGVPGLTGGYVGVDVFFVLSGFLITGLLLEEVGDTGRISLSRFYSRRIRRLLAAASLVVVATLAACAVVAGPLERFEAALDGRAVSAFVANLRFVAEDTGYFAEGTSPSPFLHFWSLAVEEQFYLVWPALLLLLARGATGAEAARRRTVAMLAVLIPVSFLACVWLTDVSQPQAFFLLPTRAWELALGAVLACVPLPALGRRAATAVSAVGLGLVVFAIASFDDLTPFPGWSAAVPVVGTVLLVLAGARGDSGPVIAALSWRPMQVVGRYSYSLYLWHWPVLVVGAMALPSIQQSWVRATFVVVVLAVPLALASFHLVEDPVRRSVWLASKRRRSYALGAALVAVGLAASVAVGAGIRFDSGREVPVSEAAPGYGYHPTDYVPTNLRPGLRQAADDLPALYEIDGCDTDRRTTEADPCVFGDPRSPHRVVLLGDSHAGQWFTPLADLARERGWRFEVLVTPGCTAFLYDMGGSECQRWRDNALAYVERERPTAVLAVDSAHRMFPSRQDTWRQALEATVERLDGATELVLFGETPRPRQHPANCLAEHLDDVRPCEPEADEAELGSILAAEREVTARVGARFVDLAPLVCWDGRCPVIADDMLVYRDASHLTDTFVMSRRNELAAALDQVLPA